jgi:hypothetical protein
VNGTSSGRLREASQFPCDEQVVGSIPIGGLLGGVELCARLSRNTAIAWERMQNPVKWSSFVTGRRDLAFWTMASIKRNVESGVALTFDDDPVPGTTDLLLDYLADLEVIVAATFFCLGRNAERNPALMSRILAEGARGWQPHPHPRAPG